MLEAELQRAVKNWLDHHRIFYWRMNLGGIIVNNGAGFIRNSLAGFPDLMGIFYEKPNHGKAWAIELKTKKGRLSDSQKNWIFRLEGHGVAVSVCRSVDDVRAFFKLHGEI